MNRDGKGSVMSTSEINSIFQSAMVAALKLAAPILVVSVVVGLVISVLQAATQIHEQTLSFVPKLIAIAIVLVIFGPWMMETMNDFTVYIFSQMTALN